MPPFVLIAVVAIMSSAGTRPVSITVEFNGLVQCEAARKNLYGQPRIEVLYSACERK